MEISLLADLTSPCPGNEARGGFCMLCMDEVMGDFVLRVEIAEWHRAGEKLPLAFLQPLSPF